jgi:2-aminoadipate transaminase
MTDRAPFAGWLNDTNDVISVFLSAGQIPDLINLGGGLPSPDVWPVKEIAEISGRVVREYPTETMTYSPVPGLPYLRDVLAKRYSSDNVPLTRDNVLVTTGGTQALSLIGQVLLNPGQKIAAQSPTYLGALDAWRPRTPEYQPMLLEADNFDPVADMTGAQFAYTVPNFSNPSGRLVDLEQRKDLLAAAHETGAWLIEDDPYGKLYYDSEPRPTLLELSGDGTPYSGPVIYVGTVSKELAPGLRIGWIIAAPEMIEALATAKQGSDMFSSGVCQMTAAKAYEEGVADNALPRVLALYRARRDALCAAMEEHLSDHLTWEKPCGGMFVWAKVKDSAIQTEQLMRRCLDYGVCISPSSVFDPEGKDQSGIRINFTLNTPETLSEGAKRLADTIRSFN